MYSSHPHLYVYKASAGSGKTFTLAVEYIKLLIVEPREYSHILAVTFTNKATAEMKERILSQLYGLSLGLPSSLPYMNKICSDLGKQPQEVSHQAGEALSLLLHDYSNFQVETIDSFFQRVMRGMARELGLGANLNLDLDSDTALSEAVDAMIEKLDALSPVMGWLLDFIEERIEDDRNWHVAGEIKSFAHKIFDEDYVARGARLRKQIEDNPACVKDYKRKINEFKKEVNDKINALVTRFNDCIEAEGLLPEDFNKKIVPNYFANLGAGNLDDKIFNKTVEESMTNPEKWATKTSCKRKEIISLAQSQLMPLLSEAEEERRSAAFILNSCNLSLKNLDSLRLLTTVDSELQSQNREKNRFLLAATNALLQSLVEGSDSSFIFEKIGANLHHVMIDEFQDTSRMQYGNFKILLSEGLSQGYDNLIVGDVKQSIYRWRNGDWRILNDMNAQNREFPIQIEKLDTNRRSKPLIIDFNNQLFPHAVEALNAQFEEEFDTACDDLTRAYADVEQKTPAEGDEGYVKVFFLNEREASAFDEKMLQMVAQEVTRLVEEEHVEQHDIAILGRYNRHLAAIAAYLQEQCPQYKVVSDEAFHLSASRAVQLLVTAVRVLSDAADTVALARLVMLYRREVQGAQEDMNSLLLSSPSLMSLLPADFSARRYELASMPLYELLEQIYRLFEISKIVGEDAYLLAFFDGVTDYLGDSPSGLASFLQEWDETLSLKKVPAGEIEGIRLLSIHKAKGLEFHTVIVPYCNWPVVNYSTLYRPQYSWCTPSEAPYNSLDLLPIPFEKKMKDSIYAADFEQEYLQQMVDSLNLLYVAFTRPQANLIVLSGSARAGNDMTTLLVNGLKQAGLYIIDINGCEIGKVVPSATAGKKKVDNKLLTLPLSCEVKMSSYDRKIEFRQSNRSADFVEPASHEEEKSKQRQYIDQGKLLHRVFSQIETAQDVEPLLARLEMEGVFSTATARENILKVVSNALALPQAAPWFSGEWRLFNECTILSRENGVTVKRRPDRVMMKDDRVVVIDFKFGNPHPLYEQQVREYMQLLVRMGYAHVEGYLWYVYSQNVEPVKM